MFNLLIRSLLPIFFILILGYLAGISGKIDNKHVTSLNTLVMDFALPAAMFSAVVQTLKPELLQQWLLMVILAVGLILLWFVVYILERRVFKASSGTAAVLAMTVALPNSAAAGMPLMTAVFGSHGRVETVVAIAIGSIVLSPLTLIMLDLDQAGQGSAVMSRAASIFTASRRAALSPLILAPLAAVAIVLLGFTVPKPIDLSVGLLGDAAGTVALLLTGLVLSVKRPQWTLKISAAVLVANVGHPALSWTLTKLLPTPASTTHAAVLLSALPVGFFGVLFALRYKQDDTDSISVVALSTIFSIATLSLTIAITRYLAG